MKVVRDTITIQELTKMSEKMFGKLAKAVVDVEQKIMIVDAEMHADQERYFLEELGSEQENLWGVNLYPQLFGTSDWIEFDSMINMRPYLGNKSRGVDDPKMQKIIITLINNMVIL